MSPYTVPKATQMNGPIHNDTFDKPVNMPRMGKGAISDM